MSNTLIYIFSATILLFLATIYLLVKQFLMIRKEDKEIDQTLVREGDCVAFSYTATSKKWNVRKSEIYAAKKSGMTPLITMKNKGMSFSEKNEHYNSVATY